jgi:hypothetical protein
MQFVEEEQGQNVRVGQIRSPDDPGLKVWMVRPDGSIGKILLTRNTKGGVLEIRDGKCVLTGTARERGWRYLHSVHGPEAPKLMDEWETKVRSGRVPLRLPPPDFYAKAMEGSKQEDLEPPEGARAALREEEREKLAGVKVRRAKAKTEAGE